MAFCMSCGAPLEEQDQFCGRCGTKRGAAELVSDDPPGQVEATGLRKLGKPKLIFLMMLSTLVWGGAFVFIFSSDGCSSTEGSLEATGKPLGDFVFTPAVCKSGEHESFYGVFLLGEHEDAGGVKVIVDPREGPFVQFEVPGSCNGGGQCTVVDIRREQCERFDIDIEKTNTTVNEIRLLDGRLGLKCAFDEGGWLAGDVTFESCD